MAIGDCLFSICHDGDGCRGDGLKEINTLKLIKGRFVSLVTMAVFEGDGVKSDGITRVDCTPNLCYSFLNE